MEERSRIKTSLLYLRLFSVLLQFAVFVTLVVPVSIVWVGSTGELCEEVKRGS